MPTLQAAWDAGRKTEFSFSSFVPGDSVSFASLETEGGCTIGLAPGWIVLQANNHRTVDAMGGASRSPNSKACMDGTFPTACLALVCMNKIRKECQLRIL